MTAMLKNRLLVSFLSLTVLSSISAVFPVVAALQDKPVLTEEQKKKVNAVNDQLRSSQQTIELSEGVRRSADSAATLIADRSSFDDADEIALRKLEELAGAVRSVATLTLFESLDNGKSQLEKVKTDLTAARDALPAEASDLPEEIGVARKKATDEIARLAARTTAQDDTRAKLQKSLAAIPGKVKVLVDLFPQRLSEIARVENTADAPALIQVLPASLAAVVEVEGQRRTLRTRWKELSSALAQAGSEDAQKNAEVTAALAALDTQVVNGVLVKLAPWFGKLETHAKAESDKAGEILLKVIEDPVMHSPKALTVVSSASALHDDLLRVNDGWTKLSVQVKGISITGFDLNKTSEAARALAGADTSLNSTIAVLQDGLTGDASRFVADQVSLYYFTDVERIMKMINRATYEIGGVKDARDRAALERQRLTTTELDLAAAMDQVNTAQQRVIALEEELRQSKSAFSSATDVLRKASRNLKSVQDDHSRNEERFNQAKAAFDANPTDPEKRLAFDRASEEKDRSAARLLASEQRNEDATRERDAAKERNDVATNEEAGLPTRIQQARDQLEIAQSAVTRQRRAAFLAAQAESEAFAFARDNRPFWFAPAIASTRDPVHRVLMYAFSDSKTIFLRGNRPDVDVAKDIIAKFDRPAPQARLTLWTMEMSSDTSSKGTERFNEALIRIEEELANNRALTSAAISFLRHCLNEEVNRVADTESKRYTSDENLSKMSDENRFRLARLRFYHDEVLARLGFAEATLAGKSQDEMRQLVKLAEFALPDPSGTTTLGEALMVLSLGKRSSRANVIKNFRDHLKSQLTKLHLTDANDADEPSWKTDGYFFTSTARVLGLDMDSSDYDGFTAAQEEIVRALERIFLDRVVAEIRSANATLQDIERQQRNSLTPALLSLQLEAKRRNVVRAAIPLINVARTRFRVGSFERLSDSSEIGKNIEELGGFAAGERVETDPRRNENARIAAADQMLKEMIIAVEDDIERHFVQRMLNRLRRKITRDKMGIGVGVMQRTSMLATNRLLARVDPRASAQLAVGEEQNILQSIQQLAQIYLTTQTGGALGFLGALDRQPREAPPEIYGINTGNVFQVTPIFDPSGQALRFKLDFVGITRIQEPSGTVSRQLPRIERHTVNTEVQLSNLEIREISRFESNTRIGRPTEYSGGLPIIKDIPKVRPYLPLLGWFVRKGGKAAVVQQSLIFGQTTMYPTILDIMDLLTPPTISR